MAARIVASLRILERMALSKQPEVGQLLVCRKTGKVPYSTNMEDKLVRT
jgi:hypothetical protein